MDYTEAVAYIEEVPKFTKKNKPENTLELIRRIGHPERNMKVIHVAGTSNVASAYAATYPIALIAVVLVSQLLVRLF